MPYGLGIRVPIISTTTHMLTERETQGNADVLQCTPPQLSGQEMRGDSSGTMKNGNGEVVKAEGVGNPKTLNLDPNS